MPIIEILTRGLKLLWQYRKHRWITSFFVHIHVYDFQIQKRLNELVDVPSVFEPDKTHLLLELFLLLHENSLTHELLLILGFPPCRFLLIGPQVVQVNFKILIRGLIRLRRLIIKKPSKTILIFIVLVVILIVMIIVEQLIYNFILFFLF